MLCDRETVRDCIRNRDGKRVYYLRKGDQLTSGAREFLSRERIEILPAEEAKRERWQLLSGGYAQEKPEHMTHLNGQILVPKTHPRIAFRGEVDGFGALLLLCQQHTQGQLRQDLEELLAYTRKLIRCDVMEEPVEAGTLCAMTERQLRQYSHDPQTHFGQPHFMPGSADDPVILWLNALRCKARKMELSAVHAFSDRDGNPVRTDILQACNRVSSLIYILMIREKAKRTGK